MRTALTFIITFIASVALLMWLSQELRVLPRGPGLLIGCACLAAWVARIGRARGALDRRPRPYTDALSKAKGDESRAKALYMKALIADVHARRGGNK